MRFRSAGIRESAIGACLPYTRHFVFLICLASLTPYVYAQANAAPATVPAGQSGIPLGVDPLLTIPVSQLSPDQIKGMQKKLQDWPQLEAYRSKDLALPPEERNRVVFLGDSITYAWSQPGNPAFFPGKPYLNRGISGQTTPQMLVRFQQDVVALHPAAVVILAGINDIAGNTGPSTLGMIEDNFRSMVAIAQANHIRVILSSTLPAIDFPWRPGLHPAEKVRDLNDWIRTYSAQHGCLYLDYYTALVDKDGGMKPGLSKDNVHPTPAGYNIMAPLAQAAIDEALKQPAP